jgi:hypothetical protein
MTPEIEPKMPTFSRNQVNRAASHPRALLRSPLRDLGLISRCV